MHTSKIDAITPKNERRRIHLNLLRWWHYRVESIATTGGYSLYGLYGKARVMEMIDGAPVIGIIDECRVGDTTWFSLTKGCSLNFPHDQESQIAEIDKLPHGRTYNELVTYLQSLSLTLDVVDMLYRSN